MPPKLPRSTKQSLIITYLQTTQTCHTLKELEKTLPPVASIPGMQVKEYIQELVDENRIRVEKIGSGNWYWSFAGDERGEKERARNEVKNEVERARGGWEKMAGRLAARRGEMQREREELGSMMGQQGEEVEVLRGELLGRKEVLEREWKRVREEVMIMNDGEEGKSVMEMKAETERFRAEAQMWTDNVYVLEGYLRRLAGGDRDIITAVQRECYGEEYVEGELREMKMDY
ncbi:putative GAJ protein [Aspergillus melleus]|uniref:putative GAJ protein n=1 Tax=Aspergillus melleus TaxID=138277 RepID=UPI001E8DC106|nr:Meiotic nuclear division protein 1 [Aspergillus melleus]KAH8428419.1 Meiotic nuclear division protein 1 [Aspergillus melleus]